MKKNKDIFKRNTVRYTLILLVGLLLGWLIFGTSSANQTATAEDGHEHAQNEVWTCSMHPQIKQDKAGKCPICGMDLIPLKSGGDSSETIDDDAIQMSKEAMALANVQTSVVSFQNPVKEIQLYGSIQIDERNQQSQAAHVSGRIEKLYVNFTGESVRQGQVLAKLYSPELLNAQQELLEALKMKDLSPELVEVAREKLRLWKLTPTQIASIEKSKKVSALVDITSNVSGVIISKNVNQGDYVETGSVLFDVANLSRLWAIFDAFEVDIPFLKIGDKVEFTLQALPGKLFSGKISFIEPIINTTTRTAKVRVEIPNVSSQLKPEMYASATIKAQLPQHKDGVVIPKSALLWTGKRSIVYVKLPNMQSAVFKLREIELGANLGESYVVLSGLTEGEEVVTQGVFSIDASAQLEGKKSMMNDDVSQPVTGHEGHDMAGSENIKGTPAAIGVTALSQDVDGNIIGDKFPTSPFDSFIFEMRYKHKIKGDKWGLGFKKVYQEVKPNLSLYENKGFIPETVYQYQFDKMGYKTRFINEAVRVYIIYKSDEDSLANSFYSDKNSFVLAENYKVL